MANVGLNGLRRKAEATGRSGPLNASWEVVMGQRSRLKDSDRWPELTDAQRLEAYCVHAIVYACVRLICDSYHTASLEIGTWKDKSFKPLKSHPVLDLLYNPNPHMSYAEFMEMHIMNLLLAGKGFIWEYRNRLGVVTEIWPVPSHWVRIAPRGAHGESRCKAKKAEHRFISHYEVLPAGAKKPLIVPTKDMTYVRMPDPTNYLDGLGPLQAAWRNLRMDLDRENYLGDMLDNLQVPGLIVRQEEEFSPQEREAVRTALEKNIGGRNRGKPLLLWGKNTGVDAVAPLADLDWPGLSAMAESHICAAFGVPPLLVHARVAQENSPLSSPNLEAAEQLFFRTTMTSLWMRSAAALTRGLVHNEGYDTNLELRHDLSEIKALQEDLTKTVTVVDLGVRSGVMKINEGRERLGLEPDPELDGMYLIPVGMTHFKPGEEEEKPDADESQGWNDDEDLEDGDDEEADLDGESDDDDSEEDEG